MSHALDRRLRAVEWRDLLPLSRCEVACETLIAAPWLAGSLVAWHYTETSHTGFAAAALLCSFFFFLTGLRQVHNAYHHALGLSRSLTDFTMVALSVSMLSAMHAIQATHLHHHRHCLDVADVEGSAARSTGWRAVLDGPAFALRLHRTGWALAGERGRRWIVVEVFAIVAIVVTVTMIDSFPLRAHVMSMLAGQCFTAFFAVWTVHHGCASAGRIARTQRWVAQERNRVRHVSSCRAPSVSGGAHLSSPSTLPPPRSRRSRLQKPHGLLSRLESLLLEPRRAAACSTPGRQFENG